MTSDFIFNLLSGVYKETTHYSLVTTIKVSFSRFSRFLDSIRCKRSVARLVKKRFKLVLSFLRYFQANLNEACICSCGFLFLGPLQFKTVKDT